MKQKPESLQQAPLQSAEVGKAINRISNRLHRRSLAVQKTVGIGRAQSGVLNYSLVESARRPLCQRDIEQEFGLRPSTATGLLKALEEQGLIERRPDEKDGRCKRIVFLEKAEAIRQTLRGEVEGTEQLLTKGITPEEQREFLRIARKMLENLDGAGESGPAEQEEQ